MGQLGRFPAHWLPGAQRTLLRETILVTPTHRLPAASSQPSAQRGCTGFGGCAGLVCGSSTSLDPPQGKPLPTRLPHSARTGDGGCSSHSCERAEDGGKEG